VNSGKEEEKMKTSNHLKGAIPLLITAALCAFTPGPLAQNSNAQDQAPPQQSDQQSKTFAGKIMKLENGKYALVTGQTPQGQMSGHFLDDQDQAKKYEGKQVKVTGTLEIASNTIHVTRIEEA
jgi:hypothetical protein